MSKLIDLGYVAEEPESTPTWSRHLYPLTFYAVGIASF